MPRKPPCDKDEMVNHKSGFCIKISTSMANVPNDIQYIIRKKVLNELIKDHDKLASMLVEFAQQERQGKLKKTKGPFGYIEIMKLISSMNLTSKASILRKVFEQSGMDYVPRFMTPLFRLSKSEISLAGSLMITCMIRHFLGELPKKEEYVKAVVTLRAIDNYDRFKTATKRRKYTSYKGPIKMDANQRPVIHIHEGERRNKAVRIGSVADAIRYLTNDLLFYMNFLRNHSWHQVLWPAVTTIRKNYNRKVYEWSGPNEKEAEQWWTISDAEKEELVIKVLKASPSSADHRRPTNATIASMHAAERVQMFARVYADSITNVKDFYNRYAYNHHINGISAHDYILQNYIVMKMVGRNQLKYGIKPWSYKNNDD